LLDAAFDLRERLEEFFCSDAFRHGKD
jgi:hypothetical protein